MSTLRTLIFIVGIYYLLKFVARLLLPIMVKKVAAKAQASISDRMRQQFEQQQRAQNTVHTEGDIKVERKPKSSKSHNDGDFVDFVEIKDK